jgi:hypothetical protein
MTCTTCRELLAASISGSLDGDAARQLDDHLAGCEACRRERAELVALRQALDRLPEPGPVRVDLARLYERESRDQAVRVRRWRRLAWAGLGAAAAALVLSLLPNLELRVGGGQLVLRWGEVPAEPPAPPPVVAAAAPPPELDRLREELRLVRDLTRLVASDLAARDRQRESELLALGEALQRLQRQAQSQWQATERQVAALYKDRFVFSPKGEQP